MRVPEVTKRMREISEMIRDTFPDEADELVYLTEELRRRVPGKRAPATSTSMTPELAEEIKEFAADNPEESHQAIANVFNVNHGRISEILSGKRR
jgi:hypothetical protein